MKKLTKNKNYLQTIRQGSFLIGLASLSLLSVGFSAWGYGTRDSVGISDIGLRVGNVTNIGDYCSFGSISMFDYCTTGVVADDTIVSAGDIKVPFSISMSGGIYSKLSDTSKFSFTAFLSSSFTGLISSAYMSSATPTIAYGVSTSAAPTTAPLSVTGSIVSSKVSAAISYSSSSLSSTANLYFLLVYHFDFSSVSSTFKASIYDNLKASGAKLNFQLKADI
jgi:hypothetical protein